MEIVGIDVHIAHLHDVHVCLYLGRESAAHVVVALLYVEIVAERAAEEYAADEDALLEVHAFLNGGEAVDEPRPYGGCLADAVGDEVGAIFHCLGVVEVEVLEEAEVGFQLLRVGDGRTPEAAQQVEAVDERLVAGEAHGHAGTEEVEGLVLLVVVGVAILYAQFQVGVMLASEQGVVVGQIARA